MSTGASSRARNYLTTTTPAGKRLESIREALDPVLLTFDPGRATQKAKYMGELFPASIIADTGGLSFLEFFQTDKDTGRTKGIIAIDLGGLA